MGWCAGGMIKKGLSLRLPVNKVMTQRFTVFIISLGTVAGQILSYSNLTILAWPTTYQVTPLSLS